MELSDSQRTLGFFGVSDGGEILMNENDGDAVHLEEEVDRIEYQRRIQVQEQEASEMQNLQKSLRSNGIL